MALKDYKTALVTGASGGIGEATVGMLTTHNIEVHAVARRYKRLEQLQTTTGCQIHALDLRDTDRLYQEFSNMEIDILVNNAGIGRGFDGLLNASVEDINTTLETNVQAAVHLIRALTPGMVKRKRGHIVNIGSVAGLYPLNSVVYGGSKGAMHSISQNLRVELKGTGIRVTEICPGRVDTGIFDASIDDAATLEKVKDTGIEVLQPEDIADSIRYALDTPWHMNISTMEIAPTDQYYGGVHMSPSH